MEVLLPAGWVKPRGYSNGIAAEGRLVFVAGQVGWNARSEFETDEFAGQVRQALANTLAVLAAAEARAEHIARMTWFVVDRHEYRCSLPAVGAAWRELIGSHYPAMSLVQVAALLEPRARVEIETTAVVPRAQ